MPMTLATLVLVNVSEQRGILYRVEDQSYPEKQAYDWHTRTKVRTRDVRYETFCASVLLRVTLFFFKEDAEGPNGTCTVEHIR